MEMPKQTEAILSSLPQPAFIAEDGIITQINTAAAQHFAQIGMAVADLITTGKEEYESFHSGSLYLTICLADTQYPCQVSTLQEGQLFVIQEDSANAELQALALASLKLNMPVSELSLLIDSISDIPAEQKAKLSQNLFRLRRILGNMADAAQLDVSQPRLTGCDLSAELEETLEKSRTLLAQNGISLSYTLPDHPIYSEAAPELLRRAVYNLLSNAAKFSSSDGHIEASVRHTGKRVLVSITGKCQNAAFTDANIFSRYTRQPGLEDPRRGLGLGMTLIHAAASAHGGTVLVEKLPQSKLRITMTLVVKQNTAGDFRSPVLLPDIYCGFDQALIELSDVLSSQSYLDM